MDTEAKGAQSQIIHNLIILDESGSMMSIYDAAIKGLNSTLSTIRQAQETYPNQEHLVTLLTFNTGVSDYIFKLTPAKFITDIKAEQYRPSGGTPLYDSIGRAVSDLKPSVKENDVVLVTVITDGYENASVEFNARQISELIKSLKDKDWVFTYIGANQDVERVAKSLSINNHLNWDSTPAGTSAMFACENHARMSFFDRVNNKENQDDDLQNDFF